MKTKLAVMFISLALVAATCNKQDSGANPASSDNQDSSSAEVLSGEVTVSMTDSGFTPSNITIKKGTKVIFVNNGTKPIWPASNPHPTHTDYPGFDPLEGIAVGQSWSFTFDKVGVWGFHDHLLAFRGGKITVVE
jgi:plastocyanin